MKSPSYSNKPKRVQQPNSDRSIDENFDLPEFESAYKDDHGERTHVKSEKGMITVKVEGETYPWLECSSKEAFTLGHLLVAAAASSADTE